MGLSWASAIVSNVLCNIYPAYASYKAVHSGDADEHRQWLSFWVVNALFTVFELFGDRLIFWLPLYFELKICFVVWLTLPRFQGATILYNSFVRQYLEHFEPAIDAHIEDARRQMQAQASDLAGRSAVAIQAFAFLGLGKLTETLGALARQQQQQRQQQQLLQPAPSAAGAPTAAVPTASSAPAPPAAGK